MLAIVRSYSANEIIGALELTGLFVMFASLPVLAYWHRARLEHRLPARRPHDAADNKPRYRHVSGAAALGIVCFVALISGISAWASMQQGRPNIDGLVGVGVIVMLVGVFVWVGFRSYQPGRKLKKTSSERKGFLFWLSRTFSMLDSWLVFPVANAIGMRLSRSWRRFLVLFGNLLPALILGWFLPVPYAFIPIVWAIISVVAIARRWS
jgi:cation transport ATPase